MVLLLHVDAPPGVAPVSAPAPPPPEPPDLPGFIGFDPGVLAPPPPPARF